MLSSLEELSAHLVRFSFPGRFQLLAWAGFAASFPPLREAESESRTAIPFAQDKQHMSIDVRVGSQRYGPQRVTKIA